MENIEDLPEEVFDLLSAKKYAEFSTSELALLKQHLREEDIKEYSVLVQDFLSLDSFEEQKIAVLPFSDAPKPAPITRNIFTRQIPLYQAVAAMVIVLVATVAAFTVFGNQNLPMATEEGNKKQNGVQFIHNQSPKGVLTDSMLLKKSKGKSLLEEDYLEEVVFTL